VRDFGFVVWAVVVIAGVVSSIVQSARKRSAGGTQAASQPGAQTGVPVASAQRLAEVRRLAQTLAVGLDQNGSPAAPRRPAGSAPRPQAKPPAASASPAPAAPSPRADQSAGAQRSPAWPAGTLERPQHRALERLFRSRHALADAVVAAEVLGKPLALRNEYADR
jgi:hypothetical protein